MNDRLIADFISQAAKAPEGQRMYKLIALVAERCATICDIETDAEDGCEQAAKTIREAFTQGTPKLSPVGSAVRKALLS